MKISLSPFTPDENLVSRDGFGRPITRQSAFSTIRLNMVLINGIPPGFRGGVHIFIQPYAIGSVPNLSGHNAIAYRWR